MALPDRFIRLPRQVVPDVPPVGARHALDLFILSVLVLLHDLRVVGFHDLMVHAAELQGGLLAHVHVEVIDQLLQSLSFFIHGRRLDLLLALLLGLLCCTDRQRQEGLGATGVGRDLWRFVHHWHGCASMRIHGVWHDLLNGQLRRVAVTMVCVRGLLHIDQLASGSRSRLLNNNLANALLLLQARRRRLSGRTPLCLPRQL